MRVLATFLLLTCSPLCTAADTPAIAQEVATATLPLPTFMRDSAAVVRLDAAGVPMPVRSGRNGMVCIADRPGDAHLDVRCYNKDFIAVVYRAFQLRRRQGNSDASVGDTIEAEIKAGTLRLPDRPTAGYRCEGPIKDYDAAANTYRPPVHCWQSIHFPYRTAAEIGLPDESQLTAVQMKTLPYVMSSGKYWAHVMIEHPDQK